MCECQEERLKAVRHVITADIPLYLSLGKLQFFATSMDKNVSNVIMTSLQLTMVPGAYASWSISTCATTAAAVILSQFIPGPLRLPTDLTEMLEKLTHL